jgi:hypothetical protein
MKYFFYNLFFIIIVLVFAYVNTNTDVAESFTPRIREFYRPYTRNVRLISEGFYNKHTSILSNLFRKFGIV